MKLTTILLGLVPAISSGYAAIINTTGTATSDLVTSVTTPVPRATGIGVSSVKDASTVLSSSIPSTASIPPSYPMPSGLKQSVSTPTKDSHTTKTITHTTTPVVTKTLSPDILHQTPLPDWIGAVDSRGYVPPVVPAPDRRIAGVKASDIGSTTTVTETVTAAIHTVIAGSTLVPQCQKGSGNFVSGVNAWVGNAIDGTCDCSIIVTTHQPYQQFNSAEDCCNACWLDSDPCIASYFDQAQWDSTGYGCNWVTAMSCPNQATLQGQGYNTLSYTNGTTYGTNMTVSNGPCGLAYQTDLQKGSG